MTIPTSVAIPALNSATNQLATSSTPNQLPASSCVSLVSTSTNGGQPLSILTANHQNSQSTMSWTTQGTPIQFATAQRPNGATICSFVPQQAIYQMPNDATTILPQTMLITQPPSRPPDPNGGNGGTMVTNNSQTAQLTGQTAAGSIVQIIQTPNGPAQLISSSPGLKAPGYTMNSANLITSSSNSVITANCVVTNTSTTSSSNSKSNKQILPKNSKSKQSTANTCTNTTSTTNSKSSASTKQQQQTTMITTSLAGSAPTMNNLSNINLNNLSQPTMGAPQLMLNTGQSSGFFTPNGLFFNQTLPTMPALGQQQFIINSAPMATSTSTSSTANKQPNQTILIPSSGQNNGQFFQMPNGQVIIVQPPPPQQTSTDTIQLAPNYNQPMLIQQPTDGQTVSYSSSNLGNLSNLGGLGNFGNLSGLGNNNFIITSQPSSFVNTTPIITTTISNSSSTNSSTTTTTTTSKSKSRRRPPAKKDNKPKVETTPVTASITADNQTNKNKGTLDLGDLLKDVGIMDDVGSSPPLSPSQQTTTTDLIDQSSTTTNTTTNLTNTDLNDSQQQQSNLLNSSTNSTTLGGQPTMVMMPPPPSNPTPMSGQTNTTSYYYNPMGQQLTGMANTAPVNTVNTMGTMNQTQFKLAVAPDGSLILTSPTFAQPMTAQQLATTQQTVQSSSLSTKFVDTSKDSCGSGSSQPSPDSTTPTLDSASTPTSCSSLTSPTITFTTNTSTNSSGLAASNNTQLGSIKLSDSFTVAQPLDDSLNKSQTTTAKKRSRSRKKKPPPKTDDLNASNIVSNTSLSAPSTGLQSTGPQLISIPIQTGLNSSNIMNSVIPNNSTNTTVIQIAGDGSNLIGNNSLLSNINSLNSMNGGQIKILNASGSMQPGSVNPPLVQISLNNQEFLDRLETQVKTLTAVKNPTQEQATLLQELIGLKTKMLEAKSNAGDSGSGEGNIILTSQPLISQPSTSPTNKLAGGITNQLTKDDVKTSTVGGTQIFTIKSLSDQGNKLSINSTSLDQNKSSLTNTPQHFIIQSTPTSQSSVNSSASSMATSANHQLQLINSDPAQTTNTFESQKIKLLTPANTSQPSMTTTTVTSQPTATTTFQLGNQFFTITTAGKPPLVGNQLSDGSAATQTLYQVVHLQPATNTGLIKLPDSSQLVSGGGISSVAPTSKETASNTPATPDKSKSKHKLISFQQQISADLSAACKPDIRTPFKNRGDACKRLLRYHVFHQSDLSAKKSAEFDKDFEVLSQYLLHKKENLYRRFQYNLFKMAIKQHSTAESIMLEKSFIEHEKERLRLDRETVEKGEFLDLPEPPFKCREKLDLLVEEELKKLSNESKKRKAEEGTDDNELSKIRKSDLTEQPLNECEGGGSEASNEEESSELNEFNKYLDNLNDINPIDGLSPLYNNSNSYNSMMQIADHQTNQSDQSHHHSNSFQSMFSADWNSEVNNPANGAEDAVAVESILDGEMVNQVNQVNQQQQPQSTSFDHDFEEDPVGDAGLSNPNGDLIFDQKSNQMGLNSENDIQMESAINSILEILVPPTNPPGTENGLSSMHNSNMVGPDGSLSSNGFNFDGASSSQVNFSQNNYLQTMPSISHGGIGGMQGRTNACSGHNDYGNDSVLDEAVKSIL